MAEQGEPEEGVEMSAEVKSILPSLVAGGKAAAIIPQTFDDCYRMGKLLAASGLVPNEFKEKPEACTVAIMQGMEVGLSPIAALQSIAVINGRPSIWGDGALAIVRASGLLESFEERHEGETAICTAKRRGENGVIVRRFSHSDAEKAGLARKPGPWTQYPARMRQMRARAWCLRDGFADVLKGLQVAEEQNDIPMRDVTPSAAAEKLVPPPMPPAPKTEEPGSAMFREILHHVEGCQDAEAIVFVGETYADEIEDILSAEERENVRVKIAEKLAAFGVETD